MVDPLKLSPVSARRGMAARVALGVALVCLFGAFIALGTWQVERRSWKHALIARVEARIHAAPAAPPVPALWPQVNEADDAYRRVRVEGVLRHDRETLVTAVTELGPGFWVMTPLALADGSTILVNRGFVPIDKRTAASRLAGNSGGRVTVTGLLRMSEPGGSLLQANRPAENRWYSRDVAAIAKARGVMNVAPYFIDADATPNPGGLPVGGLTLVVFPDNHLVYALTWYVLALMTIAGGLIAFRVDGRTRYAAAGADPS